MDLFSKKTLLSSINGAGIYGAAPSTSSVVKFAFTSNLKKIGTAGDGTITFYADSTNGSGLVLVGDQIVSSKIMDLAWAQSTATGAKTGEKVITLKYISGLGENATLNTVTLDVIDKVAAKAIIEDFFATSNTIDTSNGVANVRVDGQTILVDESNGLKTGLKIAYVPETASTGAQIQLQDKDGNIQGAAISVADIVGDGILVDSIYHPENNDLELRFGNGRIYDPTDPNTYRAVHVNIQALIDVSDIFIANDSSIYLDTTLDASTVTLHTKMQDVSTADAENNGLASAKSVREYVDSKSASLSVETGHDSYIDSSIDVNNNKKVLIGAQIADLTIADGVAGGASDSSLSGISGKLVDAGDAASKVQSFVNARLNEEIQKLDASIDSTGNTFIEVGVAEVNGKVNNVVVHETIGSITGTATDLTGVAGLISGNSTAEAVKTFVNGRLDASIQALDASLTAKTPTSEDITVHVHETDGVIDGLTVDHTAATVTFTPKNGETAANLTGSGSFVLGSDIAAIKNYVDAVAEAGFDALDSSINVNSADGSLNFKVVEENGKLKSGEISYVKSTVTYTAENNGTPSNIEATSGLLTGESITAIKNYIDTAVNRQDSQIVESDSSSYVTVTTGMVNGALVDASSAVAVDYADISVSAGAVTVTSDGIATGNDVKKAVEGAMSWIVLE